MWSAKFPPQLCCARCWGSQERVLVFERTSSWLGDSNTDHIPRTRRETNNKSFNTPEEVPESTKLRTIICTKWGQSSGLGEGHERDQALPASTCPYLSTKQRCALPRIFFPLCDRFQVSFLIVWKLSGRRPEPGGTRQWEPKWKSDQSVTNEWQRFWGTTICLPLWTHRFSDENE